MRGDSGACYDVCLHAMDPNSRHSPLEGRNGGFDQWNELDK
jgi:hypothetical protein